MLCMLLAQNPLPKVNTTLISNGKFDQSEVRKNYQKMKLQTQYLPLLPLPKDDYYYFYNICFAFCGKLSKKHACYEKSVIKRGGFVSQSGNGANIIVIKNFERMSKSQKFINANGKNDQFMDEHMFRYLMRLGSDSPIRLASYCGKIGVQKTQTNGIHVTRERYNDYDWNMDPPEDVR
jgi:hypothetical protein